MLNKQMAHITKRKIRDYISYFGIFIMIGSVPFSMAYDYAIENIFVDKIISQELFLDSNTNYTQEIPISLDSSMNPIRLDIIIKNIELTNSILGHWYNISIYNDAGKKIYNRKKYVDFSKTRNNGFRSIFMAVVIREQFDVINVFHSGKHTIKIANTDCGDSPMSTKFTAIRNYTPKNDDFLFTARCIGGMVLGILIIIAPQMLTPDSKRVLK